MVVVWFFILFDGFGCDYVVEHHAQDLKVKTIIPLEG